VFQACFPAEWNEREPENRKEHDDELDSATTD